MLNKLPWIEKNKLLKNYSTFKIGGYSRFFTTITDKDTLLQTLEWADDFHQPIFILGNGSNVLFMDEGYKGLIIKINNNQYEVRDREIIAEAGIKLSQLVKICLEKGFQGLEWAAGIPGTLGGAIRGNAGAFGREIKEVIKQVTIIKMKKPFLTKTLSNKDCQFRYRYSFFKRNNKPQEIIWRAKLKFELADPEILKKKIKEYLAYRKEHQPLQFPSIGSIFKNIKSPPLKLLKEYPELEKIFREKGAIPVGWLIERCGLKGKKTGGALISNLHANFIVNTGNARAKDVLDLIKICKEKVFQQFKIRLEEEIQIVHQ